MKALLRFLTAAAVLLLTSQEARTELPAFVYKEQQDVAPEALVIQVKSVKTRESQEATGTHTAVTAEARVRKVERTATNLKEGDTIQIEYTHLGLKDPAGPTEAPILKEGQDCPAFLRQLYGATTYMPAAGGFTFRKVE
jgi:hypothetical protein